MQHLFQRGVYNKLVLYVMNTPWDHIVVHTESLLHPQNLGPKYTMSKCCQAGLLDIPAGGTHVHTLRNSFSQAALQFQPTPQSNSGWGRVFGQISQVEVGNLCEKAFRAYNALSCSFLCFIC